MAKHEVVMSISHNHLSASDVAFKVRHGGETLGTLRVSKGSVVWVPRNKEIGKQISWKQFAEVMEASAEKPVPTRRRRTSKARRRKGEEGAEKNQLTMLPGGRTRT